MRIKNKYQLQNYKDVCNISTEMLKRLYEFTTIGKSTLQIEEYAMELCKEYKVNPAFMGVESDYGPDYPFATCISLNDTVVHGMPRADEIISSGDIVKVDFGIIKDGYYTDHCYNVGFEPQTKKNKIFLETSREAILKGVEQAIEGNKIGDIGYAIESYANEFGYNIVKEFVGHSVGESLHDFPNIPAYGKKGSGEILQKGQVLCIEAQIIDGPASIYMQTDGWTIKTRDGSNAAMFEYIVMVDKNKPLILTDTRDWEIFRK